MSDRMSDEEIHARLAPFAGASRSEMDRFNRWQDELYAAGRGGVGDEGRHEMAQKHIQQPQR